MPKKSPGGGPSLVPEASLTDKTVESVWKGRDSHPGVRSQQYPTSYIATSGSVGVGSPSFGASLVFVIGDQTSTAEIGGGSLGAGATAALGTGVGIGFEGSVSRRGRDDLGWTLGVSVGPAVAPEDHLITSSTTVVWSQRLLK